MKSLNLMKSHSTAIATQKIKQLLFIDANVANHRELATQTLPGVQSLIVEPTRDSVEQITQALQQYSSITCLHILSHGSPGCLYLGRDVLNLDRLTSYAEKLKTWSVDSILLYGCNVASGDAGAEFIEKLHQLTGAKIAASITPTGHISLGGNWNLEHQVGTVAKSEIFTPQVKDNWKGILETVLNTNFTPLNFTTYSLVSGSSSIVQTNNVYRYTNVFTGSGVTVDAKLTITNISNASFQNQILDNNSNARFEPYIGSTNSAGGYVDFKFEFVESGTNTPVQLQNFAVTGVDVDGNSTSAREYQEIGGFSSYQVDQTTQLTIQSGSDGRTRFLGRPSSLTGVSFDNTAAYIANFTAPVNALTMRIGVNGNTGDRQFSVGLGTALGTFTTPITTTASTVTSQTTNDITPTITGTANLATNDTLNVQVNGVTYTFSNDGTANDSPNLAVNVASKTWALTIPNGSELPQGTYNVNASVTNSSGVSLFDQTSSELVVDTTPPTITITSPTTTKDTTPAISGITEPNLIVTVSIDTNGDSTPDVTYTTTANGSGNWSVDLETATPLPALSPP
ncbi:MAG: DUF4347 domain-containing protein [Hydrococcus sp. RM1_1_31]|nr:DUF4347 domain-containing protein [Hydrococcus sp. RM1_1_31]